MKLFIIFLGLLYLVQEAFACLGIDNTGYDKCSFCSSDLYSETFYTSSLLVFRGETCKSRTNPASPYISSFYITNSPCAAGSACDGSEGSPFDDPLKALSEIEKKTRLYFGSEVKIFFLKGNGLRHVFFKNSLPSSSLTFFRRTNISIEIRPLYCSERSINGCLSAAEIIELVFKTLDFSIFVAGKLKIEKFSFKGIDSHLDELNSCLTQASDCCDYTKIVTSSDSCYIGSAKTLPAVVDSSVGFFNIEPLFDKDSGFPVPSLEVLDISFNTFFVLNKGFDSVIKQEGRYKVSISIKNVQFEKFLTGRGIVYINQLSAKTYYKITSIDYTKITIPAVTTPGSLTLSGVTIKDFNTYKVTLLTTVISALYIYEFDGTCLFTGVYSSGNVLPTNFINYDNAAASSIRSISLDDISIIKSTLTSAVYLKNTIAPSIKRVTYLSENTVVTVLMLVSCPKTLIAGGGTAKGVTLPSGNYLNFQDCYLTLSDLVFDNLRGTGVYYLLRSSTFVDVTVDIQMKSAIVKDYAKDSLFIKNCTFNDLNVNVVTNDGSILLFEMNNSYLGNISVALGQPIINLHTERYGFFYNTTFINIKTNQKLIRFIYTRNWTMDNCYIAYSEMLMFFDVYVITEITDNGGPNCVLEVRNSKFSNIKIYSPTTENINFFYTTTYTLFYGIYSYNTINVTFEEIVNPVLKDDVLILSTTGHNVIIGCVFRNISNLTIHRIYTRLRISNVTIIDTLYSMMKYPWAQIYFVSPAYVIERLIIRNTLLETNMPMINAYALEFYDTGEVWVTNLIVLNVFSAKGNAFRANPSMLSKTLIRDSYFFKNSGANENGADMLLKINQATNINWKDFIYDYKKVPLNGVYNCTFLSSASTGSLTLQTGELIIRNCSFKNIWSDNSGGAIYAGPGSNFLITDTTFLNITSKGSGGVINFVNSLMFLINSTLFNASSLKTGGILMSTKTSVMIILNCIFKHSTSKKGGFVSAEDTVITIKMTNMFNSSADLHGAFFYMKKSDILLLNSSITQGTSLTAGALYGELLKLNIENVAIRDCSCSLEKGLGTIFIIGRYQESSSITNLTCERNSAMTGGCIYAQDVMLTITNSRFYSGFSKQDSIIALFTASLNSMLNMSDSEFKGNQGGLSIFKAELAPVELKRCKFINETASSSVINIDTTEIYLINCYFESKDGPEIFSSNSSLIYSFVFIRESNEALITSCTFLSKYQSSAIYCQYCKILYANKNSFQEGLGEYGGAVRAESSEVDLENNAFEKNKAFYDGAAIYLSESNGIVQSNFFNDDLSLKNRGSDVFISNQRKDIAEVQIQTLKKNKFTKIHGISVYMTFAKANLEENTFIGETGLSAQAIFLENCYLVKIIGTNISKMYGMGGLAAMNDYKTLTNLIINQSAFTDCTNSNNGGLLSIDGLFNIIISYSNLTKGQTNSSGGGIMYTCEGVNCSLRITDKTIIKDCEAAEVGGAIYSDVNTVDFDYKNAFLQNNFAPTGPNIYTFAISLIIVPNVSSEAELKNYTRDNLTSDLSLLKFSITPNFTLKSGFHVFFGIVLLDHQNNVVINNDDIATVSKNEYLNTSKTDFRLEKSVAKISKGMAVLEKVSIVAESLKYYDLVVTVGDVKPLKANFTLYVTPCEKGEIVDDNTCVPCGDNFFSLVYNPENVTKELNKRLECSKCPDYSTCGGGEKIIPKEGYWRKNENTTLILKCHFMHSCPEQLAMLDETKIYWKYDYKCAKGFYGNICKNCEIGYVPYYNGCEPCESNSQYSIVTSFKFIILLLYSLAEIILCTTSANKPHRTLFRIVTYHNAFIVALTNLHLNVDPPARDAYGRLDMDTLIANKDLYSFYCVIQKDYAKADQYEVNTVFQIFTPFLYMSAIFITSLVLDFVRYLFGMLKDEKKGFIQIIIYKFLLAYLISYRYWLPRVIITMMGIYRCINLGETNVEYMNENPDIMCYSDQHNKLIQKTSAPGIIIYLFITPGVILLLLLNRGKKFRNFKFSFRSLMGAKRVTPSGTSSYFDAKAPRSSDPEKVNKKTLLEENDKSVVDSIFNLLAIEFKYEHTLGFFVEIIIIILMIVFTQLTNNLADIVQRMILFIFYCICYLFYMIKKPYLTDSVNNFYCFSLVICMLTMILEVIATNRIKSREDERGPIVLMQMVNYFFYLIITIAFYPPLFKRFKSLMISIWILFVGILPVSASLKLRLKNLFS